MIEHASLGHCEVNDGRGEFDILRPGTHSLLRSCRSLLRETRSVERMNFLKLVPSGEFQDHATSVAGDGLRAWLLDMDIASEDCGAQQVPPFRHQELGLVRAAARLKSLLW